MSIEQVKKEFPERWILLANDASTPIGETTSKGGFFVYKNKNRKKVYEKVAELIPKGAIFSVLFTGEERLADNAVLCL